MNKFYKKLKHRWIAFLAGLHYYGNPSKKIKIIGITGTNGKTTTATLLYQLFRNLGYKVGLIGTVVNKINDESIKAKNTTPGPVVLNDLLNKMVQASCEYCFMEVSSHAIAQNRIAGLTFSGGVFTNLTQDHMDYHKNFDNYFQAKKKFFKMLSKSAFVLSNIDDPYGLKMTEGVVARKYYYSLKNKADLPAGEAGFTGRLETKLIGEFNAYNILAIYATALLLGQDKEKVKKEIKNLEPVTGRFQYIKSNNGVTGIVDYAHTPDALENVLKTVNGMNLPAGRQEKSGKVIALFGCGGDRDRTKRPIMARIGYDMSDILILTSDNPRTEKPEDILSEMKKDLPTEQGESLLKVSIIPNRREAIQKGCELAKAGDYILIAGKGHENYQEINGVKNHFDDMEELKRCFNL